MCSNNENLNNIFSINVMPPVFLIISLHERHERQNVDNTPSDLKIYTRNVDAMTLLYK